jgi:hypothetical protein
MQKECNICGREAALVCGDCADRFYCSKDCQTTDLEEHYDKCDYEGVAERLVGVSILGIGPWKRIVRKHIELTVNYLQIRGAGIKGRGNFNKPKADLAVGELLGQVRSWTRQFPLSKSARNQLTLLLNDHISAVKALIDAQIELALNRNATRQRATITRVSALLGINAGKLANFFYKHRPTLTLKIVPQLSWYTMAWNEHIR